MTSVPKPLKFLRPHYPDLQALYETWQPSENKVSLPLPVFPLPVFFPIARLLTPPSLSSPSSPTSSPSSQ